MRPTDTPPNTPPELTPKAIVEKAKELEQILNRFLNGDPALKEPWVWGIVAFRPLNLMEPEGTGPLLLASNLNDPYRLASLFDSGITRVVNITEAQLAEVKAAERKN